MKKLLTIVSIMLLLTVACKEKKDAEESASVESAPVEEVAPTVEEAVEEVAPTVEEVLPVESVE